MSQSIKWALLILLCPNLLSVHLLVRLVLTSLLKSLLWVLLYRKIASGIPVDVHWISIGFSPAFQWRKMSGISWKSTRSPLLFHWISSGILLESIPLEFMKFPDIFLHWNAGENPVKCWWESSGMQVRIQWNAGENPVECRWESSGFLVESNVIQERNSILV